MDDKQARLARLFTAAPQPGARPYTDIEERLFELARTNARTLHFVVPACLLLGIWTAAVVIAATTFYAAVEEGSSRLFNGPNSRSNIEALTVAAAGVVAVIRAMVVVPAYIVLKDWAIGRAQARGRLSVARHRAQSKSP